MKASMKFREEQKPLFRAKVPLSILGLPFQSGIVAGESKELSLNLSTFFESGPSLKVAYRPNDSWNPFSLIVKTGSGSFGSPISSSMLMSAEFNLLGKGNPSFMLHFKPQFGDFSIKKSHSSSQTNLIKSMNGSVSGDDSSIEVVDTPAVNGCGGGFRKVTVLPSTSAGDIAGLLSGVEVAARTSLPVRGRAVLNFRWGVRVPTEIRRDFDPTAAISLRRFPFLVMNKIGIEHVDGSDAKVTKPTSDPGQLTTSGDVAEVCLAVNRQMEELRTENKQLKRAVEDLREVISNVRPYSPATIDYGSHSKYREPERSNNNGRSRADRWSSERTTTSDYGGKKSKEEGDVAEELKKALKGAA
ncbi:unnamed protein product [Arabidopsis lyrata]|uniref:Uncharacterized protein n=1 Tax=Arabidopsis lyrata subsp. lyrata TaxID=81972 RepID=D7LVY7_ARALL|nr:uncharacterized protein LOC9314249 [Arabidopsis lyrata subsp. lyrata]EFH54440.1 hypothetical protein ARALYDRAFT_486249 [Arabidopsis lyrata subsp. lyrata]CAH8268995.1 unnamed protein product [Arabidopsis lyrata]|eukprot:XP_020879682.1 uncharacterized protein LOC9314249 [Arabidopsis lyrata subsp. lyrata]